MKSQIIERAFLPQFTFTQADLVIPVGLVVNAVRYVDGQPILAVNPFTASLLPQGEGQDEGGFYIRSCHFSTAHTLPHVLRAALYGQARTQLAAPGVAGVALTSSHVLSIRTN